MAREDLLGTYQLETVDGQALPVARNPSLPDLVTTDGWFENETDFDLTGQWSDTSLVLVDPTGTKLVYRRS